jgi:hypothetical protein
MASRSPHTLHATPEPREVKRGITQEQADEIGRILVREYETNEEFRAVVDAKCAAGLKKTGSPQRTGGSEGHESATPMAARARNSQADQAYQHDSESKAESRGIPAPTHGLATGTSRGYCSLRLGSTGMPPDSTPVESGAEAQSRSAQKRLRTFVLRTPGALSCPHGTRPPQRRVSGHPS